jgi:hypothetical protein
VLVCAGLPDTVSQTSLREGVLVWFPELHARTLANKPHGDIDSVSLDCVDTLDFGSDQEDEQWPQQVRNCIRRLNGGSNILQNG